MTEAHGKHSFSVEFSLEVSATFQQVEIANCDLAAINYRHGNSPVFYPIKMPGLGRVGNIAMRKGVFTGGPGFSAWCHQVGAQESQPGCMTISRTDEEGRVMTWTLHEARPVKVTGMAEGLDGGKAAVELVEVVFEQLVVSAP